MKSNIRELRRERNLSQTELAEVIGKTQQTISHMEKDRDRISIESLITLAEYFGVSTDYVLGIESDEGAGSENKSTVLPDKGALKNDALKNKTLKNEMESLKSSLAGENKRILYQLVLSLLLFSLDDETAGSKDMQKQHI